jgi:pilus assembly protein TadC
VSTYLIASYAGVSLPVIGIGLVANATGPATADVIFAVFIALLALFAVVIEWSAREARHRRQSDEGRSE